MKTIFQKAFTFNVVYGLVIFLCFFYFSWLILSIPQARNVEIQYPDSIDYKNQSQIPLSADFFAPEKGRWFSPRPFTLPLLYKVAGSNAHRLVIFQQIIYCLSVLIFTLSIASLLRTRWMRLLLCPLLFFFFTWWVIVGWSIMIVSESLSFSFLLLWLSALLWYFRSNSRLSLSVLLLVLLLFSFTRDSWPYMLLLFALVNFIVRIRSDRKTLINNSVLLLFTVSVFLIQSYTIARGNRSDLPVFNSIVGRISQTPAYLDWFRQRGMPQADLVEADFRGIDVSSEPGKRHIYRRYIDSTYLDLFEWVRHQGRSAFMKFLITHPSYLLMLDERPEEKARLFFLETRYFPPHYKFFHNANHVFPIFPPWLSAVLTALCAVLFFRSRELALLLPLLLLLFSFINAVLIYNADTLEVGRHMYATYPLFELSAILALFFMGGHVAQRQSLGPAS